PSAAADARPRRGEEASCQGFVEERGFGGKPKREAQLTRRRCSAEVVPSTEAASSLADNKKRLLIKELFLRLRGRLSPDVINKCLLWNKGLGQTLNATYVSDEADMFRTAGEKTEGGKEVKGPEQAGDR
ncbi:hypothetical protein KUCAC02_033564, partial [Chaenocephalus aceratus]